MRELPGQSEPEGGASVENMPMGFEPPLDAIQPRLQTCGLAADDTLMLVSRLAEGESLEQLSREIRAGLLLRKRSASGRKQVLAAVRIRYANAQPPLPGVTGLAVALRRFSAPVARAQTLLPYLLLADRVAYEIVVEDVLPRLGAGGRLTKLEVVDALDALLMRHGRKRWSDALRNRWAQGLLSVLRDVDVLGRGKNREVLKPYAVRPEVVCFHLWGLYDHGLRGPALHETEFWRALLLRDGEARRQIGALADRGWWKFTSLAGTDEIVPVFESLREWLAVGLG